MIRQIGVGGMGAVYEAEHEAIGRHAAVKVLHARYAQDPDLVARFFNEAKATNRVEHPGLVQIYDFGRLPDGTAFLGMELLRGETLGGRLRRLGALPARDVASNLQAGFSITLEALAAPMIPSIAGEAVFPSTAWAAAQARLLAPPNEPIPPHKRLSPWP